MIGVHTTSENRRKCTLRLAGGLHMQTLTILHLLLCVRIRCRDEEYDRCGQYYEQGKLVRLIFTYSNRPSWLNAIWTDCSEMWWNSRKMLQSEIYKHFSEAAAWDFCSAKMTSQMNVLTIDWISIYLPIFTQNVLYCMKHFPLWCSYGYKKIEVCFFE